MNFNIFYGKDQSRKVQIDVNQGIYHPVDNNYEVIPNNDLSDISDFSDKKDPEHNYVHCNRVQVN